MEEEKLQKILETAHVAPTAANMQPVRLIVVRSREGLSAVSESANIYGAPVAVVVCADKSKAWTRPFDGMVTTDIDASILTDHMMLMVTELGLGSVWICYFKPDVLKQGLDLPENLEPINEKLKAARTLAEFFRDKGMVIDMNLHDPDHKNPNLHCHLMLTMRPFEKDGSYRKMIFKVKRL